MATIIEGGAATFDATVLGAQHPGTIAFIRQQFNTFTHHVGDAARSFIEETKELFESLNNDNALQLLRSARRALDSIWLPNEIQPLYNIGQVQHAPDAMVRWIMADVETRQMYHQGRIEGYGERYVDLQPGKVGEDHYDYRRVMNGVVVVDKESDGDGDYGWQTTTYFERLRPDDRELELVEQQDILRTYALLAKLRENSEDYTSPYGADIA